MSAVAKEAYRFSQRPDAEGYDAAVYESLVYPLLQAPLQRGGTSLLLAFTSVHPREGVTHVTRSLVAAARATLGLDVALLDMSWIKTQSLQYTVGVIPGDAGGAVSSAWLAGWESRRSLADQVRNRARIVVLDCPAMRTSPDPLYMAPFTDGLVLVVEANRTRRDEIRGAAARIEAAGGKIAGLVLNKTRPGKPGRLAQLLGLTT